MVASSLMTTKTVANADDEEVDIEEKTNVIVVKGLLLLLSSSF